MLAILTLASAFGVVFMRAQHAAPLQMKVFRSSIRWVNWQPKPEN